MLTVSVSLSTLALRRALDLLDQDGVDSLDELVERLIASASDRAGVHSRTATAARRAPSAAPRPALLASLRDASPPELAPTPTGSERRLSFLTNRLNPVKIFCRALANSALTSGAWPHPNLLTQDVGLAARDLGLRLRVEDAAAGCKGHDRRWVAYPVGERPEVAMLRFGSAFGAAHTPSGELGGPLVVLGLVTARGEAVALSEAGWQLAALPSPLLGEIEAGRARLSDEEAALLRERLLSAPQEKELIADLIASIREGEGRQTVVDRALASRRPEWSSEHAASERAALVGRLHELGAVTVVGRGREARIDLLDTEALEREQS